MNERLPAAAMTWILLLTLSLTPTLVLTGVRPVQAAPVELGAADPGDWAMLSLGGYTVTVNNQSVVRDLDENGSDLGPNSRPIGIQGSGGKLQMSGNGRIGGPALLADGTVLGITTGNPIEGGIYGTNLSGDPKGNVIVAIGQDVLLNQAASDAISYAALYAGLAATNTSITSVTGTTTILAAAGLNVLSLTALDLGGGEILTLDGQGLDASFVVNVHSDLKLASGKIFLTGGLTLDEVLFNVIGGKVAFSGGGNASVLQGTILALDGEVAIAPGLIQGSIIGRKITLTSGADLDTPIPEVPEPSTLAVFGLALVGLGFWRRGRSTSARRVSRRQ